ncbi:DNA polymerase I [Tistrella bauzanensis]|uniref:DNA polymerase I n=1 Tax=Tistrella bauzanensis TaxID=657419 RepID=A0ABQ1IXT6_9PROT|nr:DNA polymerase I [Tistrella bauzanensis]GGB55249.1 DNA polymerase I [Tistrella bauzanensis]
MSDPTTDSPVIPASSGSSAPLYLIDGSGYIFRAFHALPPLTRPDGTPVNAVYGFCAMILKLIEDLKAERLAVIFDAGRRSFRNDIYPEYKAHRPEAPEELVPQFPLIRDATRAFALPCIEMVGYEADDLIASYARAARDAGQEVVIVSADKDLMQLVRDGVALMDPMKAKRIGADQVFEKFGVAPDRVVDVQALAGDSTDNVPGVPGIGIKTAAQLIGEYGDLDTLLARASEIKQPKRRQNLIEHADKARMSRELVRLREDVALPDPLGSLHVGEMVPEVVLSFLEQQGFSSLIAKLRPHLGHIKPVTGGSAGAGAAAVADEISEAGRHYELVQDEAALARWIEAATEAGIVGFDTETTGLDPHRASLVGLSLAVSPGRACYVPLRHVAAAEKQGALDLSAAQGGLDLAGDGGSRDVGAGDDGAPPVQIPVGRALEMLKPLLEAPGVLKVGQNIKYDMIIMAREGILVSPIDDTMVMSYALDGTRHGHGMDELAQIHLGVTPISFDAVTGRGRDRISFAAVTLDRACAYAAEDADITLNLHRMLKPRLAAEHVRALYERTDRALVPVLARMERRGIRVDREALGRASREFADAMAILEARIHELAGESFNVGSPKQLGEILFDKLNLPGGKKGKTGAYATGADILQKLVVEGHELPAKVLDWRQLAKLKNTYADALVETINPETGRVHTSFALTITTTGRLSSNDPNLQNIPVRTVEGRRIRRAFVPDPGFVLMSADYSQIELRLLADIAGITTLRDAFRDGIDIHALTASQVFGVPVDGMDPMVRRKAKAINFGIIYGISAFGLAQQLDIPQSESRRYIEAYFERYPGIRDYMERAKADARAHGFVTTIFGRKCWTPDISAKNPALRAFAERAAINAPLQGSAADIVRLAMVQLDRALEASPLGARMLLQVHDEILLEVPVAEVDETSALVRQVMQDVVSRPVPYVVEVGIGDNWDAAH